jgi:hypothetical protein
MMAEALTMAVMAGEAALRKATEVVVVVVVVVVVAEAVITIITVTASAASAITATIITWPNRLIPSGPRLSTATGTTRVVAYGPRVQSSTASPKASGFFHLSVVTPHSVCQLAKQPYGTREAARRGVTRGSRNFSPSARLPSGAALLRDDGVHLRPVRRGRAWSETQLSALAHSHPHSSPPTNVESDDYGTTVRVRDGTNDTKGRGHAPRIFSAGRDGDVGRSTPQTEDDENPYT